MLKKSFLLCLFFIMSFILMSFNYQTFNLSYDNNTLYYGDNSYKLKEENYITLINDDGNNQEYLIIMGDIELFFDSADENYYYFAGYNNEEILTLRVDISKGRYIIDMCLCNKINQENNNYLDYYLIRDKYYELRKANTISIKRSSTPYIDPYTLEQMTSSDRYLDGYEPTKYSVVTDTRYEDPIVNIIPKELFFTEGKYVYYGEEYIFAINTTYETHTDNVNYYASRVVVFDIDITDPRSSRFYDSGTDVGYYTEINGFNIVIDMPIMEVYVGIENNNSKFQSGYHIDDSQERVVVEQGAFLAGYGIDQSPLPIYMDLEYLSGDVSGADDLAIDDFISFDKFKFMLDSEITEEYDDDTLGTEIGKDIVDMLVSSGIAKLLSYFLKPKPLAIAEAIVDLALNAIDYCTTYNNNNNENKILKRTGNIFERNYLLSQSLNVSEDIVHSFLIALSKCYSQLIESDIYDYSYKIGFSFELESTILKNILEADRYRYTNMNLNIALKGTLYDYLGNPLNYIRLNGVDNSYYYSGELNSNQFLAHKSINLYTYFTVTQTNAPGFNTTINYSNEVKTLFYNSNLDYTALITLPNNVQLEIFDYNGRKIASSNNGYFNSNKLICNFDKNKKYYFAVNFTNNKTGKISVLEDFFKNLTTNYTYNNSIENVEVFKLGSSTIPRTYNFFTNSNQDTKILIFGENGNIKAYNDDAYYDPNNDTQDYNSAVTYHVNRNEIIYILVYGNGITPYNKEITFNAFLQ